MAYLEMRHISKRFGPVQALDEVDFEVDSGQIVGLIGQNGAGKSTLIKILGGVYRPDAGEIRIAGRPTSITSPAHATRLGISIIHQEFNLIPRLSVAQNLFLGREPVRRLGFIDRQRQNEIARELLARVRLDIDPETPVEALSVAQKQLVEIARALSTDSRIFVMDEPTAALNGTEVATLFQVVRSLKAEGKAIIFVSHRLEEVFEISEHITILRDGRLVGRFPSAEIGFEMAIRLMTGKEAPANQQPRTVGSMESPVLEVRGLTLPGVFSDLSFTVRRGEVVALVGLEGQGQREVIHTLFGLHPDYSGEVYIDGRLSRLSSPQQAIANGVGFVPEERKVEGLCLSRTVTENVALATLGERQLGGIILRARELKTVGELVQQLRIITPSLFQLVQNLSGGNQQKVVIARWLAARPKLLLFLEPTRGVDVGAKEEIYRLIGQVSGQGTGVLFVSSDMQEVMRLAHRILVMYEGRIVRQFTAGSVTRAEITEAQWGYVARQVGHHAG